MRGTCRKDFSRSGGHSVKRSGGDSVKTSVGQSVNRRTLTIEKLLSSFGPGYMGSAEEGVQAVFNQTLWKIRLKSGQNPVEIP